MPERPRVLQMGPDPRMGGGMAASIQALLDSPLADEYELDLVPTYAGAKPLPRLGVFLMALLRLTGWSLRGRGRIVHIHMTVRGSSYRKSVCVLLAKALRRRVVLHVHSGAIEVARFRATLSGPSLRLIGAAYGVADIVLSVSDAGAAALQEAYGVDEVINVLNPAPIVAPFERRRAAAGEPVEVAFLGGFANPVKGGEEMVAAVRQALDAGASLRVTLAGPGEPSAAATTLIAAHDSVRWAGWLDPAAKDAVLREAEVFVMPSLSEGLPMALLEAMAYRLAIVASEVGGIPEVVGGGEEAVLVPAGETDGLAAVLAGLAADPARREALAAGAARRVEEFSPERVAARLAAIYAALD
jgi:glycosyltransferase involved in cell wall biosynthesis